MTTEQDKNHKQGNITSMNFEVYTPVATTEKVDRKGMLQYGDDNNFPQYLSELSHTCAIHGALCKSLADMVAGKGLQGQDLLELYECVPAIANDLQKQGGFYLEVIYSADGKSIAKVNHLAFSRMRLNIDEDTESVTGAWFSRDWTNTRKKVNEPKYLPRFNHNQVTRENEIAEPRQVIIAFPSGDGIERYPKPDYWGAINHIETSRQLALYNVNSFMNGLFPSFIINFRNGVPDPDEQREVLRNWEKQMSGARNTGKFVATFNEPGADASPQIEAFPMNEANTTYLELAYRQANEQIFIGHRVTTPRLFGIIDSSTGLGSNTDEMLAGLKILLSQVIEPKQRFIEKYLNKINAVNGQGEVKIIPADIPIQEPEPKQPLQLEEKKKDELSEFIALGEDSPTGYLLIDAFDASTEDDAAHETELTALHFVATGTARPNSKSEQDKKIGDRLFITRYRYRGERKPDTREFCRRMLDADKLYRIEDIEQMENRAVNPGWGPNGTDTYSIKKYKGGGNCHHFWQKEVYVSAEGLGIDVTNPQAQQIAVARAEKAGYKVRNEALVARLPIDMPYNGFLPTNPIYGAK